MRIELKESSLSMKIKIPNPICKDNYFSIDKPNSFCLRHEVAQARKSEKWKVTDNSINLFHCL